MRAASLMANGNLAPLLTRVPLQLRAEVERIAYQRRESLAEVVRQAVEEHVQRARKEKR
jgi:hypothetical protein